MLKNKNNTFVDKQIVLMTLGPLSLDGYSSRQKPRQSGYPCSSKGAPHLAGGRRATLREAQTDSTSPGFSMSNQKLWCLCFASVGLLLLLASGYEHA